MKKIKEVILGYIQYITQLNFLCLAGTFLRILVYFLIVMDFMNGKLFIGFLLLATNLLSTFLTITAYRIHKDRKYSNFAIKMAKNSFKKNVINSVETDIKDLPIDEQIELINSFIEVIEELLKQAEKELNELQKEKENEDEK